MKPSEKTLWEVCLYLGQAKVALFKAEKVAHQDKKGVLNDLWWEVDALHQKISKLI